MSIYYIRPVIRDGKEAFVIYNHAGQPMSTHADRVEALMQLHVCMNTRAVLCIGTLQNIFQVSDGTSIEAKKCPTTEPNRLP